MRAGLDGLGVGALTLVDRDEVRPRNFSRQFLYRHADIGRSKVDRAAEWVRVHDPGVEVPTVDRWIGGPDDLTDLTSGIDVMVGGLDGEPGSHLWMNEAAVRAGVPLSMQIGSLVACEALRYLTGFEAPRAAGAHVVLDLKAGLVPVWEPFAENSACPGMPLGPALARRERRRCPGRRRPTAPEPMRRR